MLSGNDVVPTGLKTVLNRCEHPTSLETNKINYTG